MTNSPNKMISIYSAFSSRDEAETAAETLVKERLVACANIFPEGTSVYIWKDRLLKEKETYVFFKTSSELSDKACRRLKELHSYEVPAVLKYEVGASPEYLTWIKETGNQ